MPTDGFPPSYQTTLGSDFCRISRAGNIHHKNNDTVMAAFRKLDRGGIPRQIVFFYVWWQSHPREPPISTIGHGFHTLRKFSGTEILHIHPGLPILSLGATKIKNPRARDPANHNTFKVDLDRVGVPLLPCQICAPLFSSQLEECLCLHDETAFIRVKLNCYHPLGGILIEWRKQGLFRGGLVSASVQVEEYLVHIRAFTRVEIKRGLCQVWIDRSLLCVDECKPRGANGLTRCEN